MTDPIAASSTPAVGDEFVGPFPSWINIKTAYGAKGDGITDDTAAFQRALTDLGTPGHGNVLWIPAGTYKITSQLNLSSRLGVSIIGEDPATTILKWAGPGVFSTDSTTGSMFVINGVADSRFDRLTFDGSGSPIVLVDQAWDGVSNYFDTGNEYADDNFQNANIGIRGGVLGQGFAETSILRDHFTDLKVIGVITMKGNTILDTTDPISVFGGSAGPYVVMDKVIRSKSTVSRGPVVSLSDIA